MATSRKGFSKMWIIIGVIIAAFIALIAKAYTETTRYNEFIGSLDFSTILEGNSYSGDMPDNTTPAGEAEVIIFEYADYQCPGCSRSFPLVSEVVKEYNGKVALVFRSFIMSYHQNGTAAASAANAAALQGYWHEYAELLFAGQSDWEYASGEKRDAYFDAYFNTATSGKGDLEKFRSDMRSEAVKKKISFDATIAKKVGVTATPSFYINGELIELTTSDEDEFKDLFRAKIDAALKNKS